MITILVIKILDGIEVNDPGYYWYGAAFAFLLDVAGIAVAWAWCVGR